MLGRKAIIVALLSTAGVAHAGDKPLYQAAPGWVAAAPAIDPAKINDAAPVVMLFDQQQRLEDGQVWTYLETALRMASPQMLTQSGTLPLQWDPSKGDLMIHKLQIVRGGERIDLIAKGTRFTVLQREQKLEQFSLDGTLTATVAVEGLRVGDVLDVAFSITRKDPTLGGDMMTTAPLVPSPTKLGFGRVRLLWKDGVPLKWRDYSAGVVNAANASAIEPKPVAGGYRELLVPLPTAKPAEVPDDAPQRYKPMPILEASTFADWQSVSKTMAPYYRTEGAIAPGSPLAAEVARIAKASSDPRTRAAMALRLVQDEVRYLFRGMDNGNYVPQKPADTWSLRYGDCKAKTLLLTALLRALDIEAEPALVSSSMGDLVAARLPSPAAFDHVIVRASIAGKTLWLDGTQGGSRLEDLDDVPAFRAALPVREAGAAIEPMPLHPPARPEQEAAVTLDGSAGIDFPALFTFSMTFNGGTAESLRGMKSQIDQEKLGELIGSQISSVLGVNSAYDQKMEDDPAAGTVTLTAKGIAYPEWNYDRGRFRLSLDRTAEAIDFSPNRGRTAWKNIPVAAGAFNDRRVTTRVKLPDGGKQFTLEGQQTLPAALATMRLARNVALAGDMLTITDRMTSGIEEVPADRIAAVRAEVARVKADPLKAVAPADHPPRWKMVLATRGTQRLAPILTAYDKAIAVKPDEAESYTNRAWFNERIYDYRAAAADVTKAIDLEATAELLVRRAGLYHQLNQADLAVKDLEAALELDSASDGATAMLASIRGDQGKIDEARALLDPRIEQGGDGKMGWQMALANVLADGGEVDEALSILDDAVAKAPGNAALLNGRCWIRGTHNVGLDLALQDCTKAIELSQNAAAILDSRAMVYFRMNRLAEAVTDLDAALLANPEQSASLFMRGVIAGRTKAKDADLYLKGARMIEPRIDERFAVWGIKP
ncbi:DUF3857 domain-containing protein [Sphingomonas sp. RS6]